MSGASSQADRQSLESALQLLQLAARLHTAHANPDAWREILLAFRDCTPCHGVATARRKAPHWYPRDTSNTLHAAPAGSPAPSQ